MSRAVTGKRAIWLAGVAAIMPVATAATPPALPASVLPLGFAPPDAPMVLTRTLRRPLPGGAEVRTHRSYEIRIVPDGAGYRVDGQLIGVEVDAPPVLQALAALERNRPDDGLFPMRLDARGRLLAAEEAGMALQSRQAVDATRRQVNALSLDRPAEAQAQAFVGQFESRPGRTAWPEDLFSPAPGQRRETRSIPLPNGQRGEVTVDIEAEAAAPTGLLSRFERRVMTQLGANARVTEETWTLRGKT